MDKTPNIYQYVEYCMLNSPVEMLVPRPLEFEFVNRIIKDVISYVSLWYNRLDP